MKGSEMVGRMPDAALIVGIGGQATVIGKELEFEREKRKGKIKVCLKFEEFQKEEIEEIERCFTSVSR